MLCQAIKRSITCTATRIIPLRYLKTLLVSEMLGLSALLIVSVFFGVGVFAEAYMTYDPEVYTPYTPVESGIAYFQLGLIVGSYVVVLYAAPVYSILRFNGVTSYWSSACIGLAPSFLIFFISVQAGIYAVSFGVTTGIVTHWLDSRFSSILNSK